MAETREIARCGGEAEPDGGRASTTPRRVAFDAPWMWLAAGWRDLWQAPWIGLGYGATVVLGALALSLCLFALDAQSLFPALVGGFLLLAPFFAGEPVPTAEAIVSRPWR